jgi:hypothetical protein
MMHQVLSPSVQDGEYADLGSKVLRIGRDLKQCFRSRLKQDAVNDSLILQSYGRQAVRYRKHHVEVWHRQEFFFASGHPSSPSACLAFRTVSVPARVVSNPSMIASVALFYMAA